MGVFQTIGSTLANFALPPRCGACGVVVPDDLSFCLDCWQSLHFLGSSGCNLCGEPIDALDLTCAACLLKPPEHDGVRSCIAYGEVARTVVTRFKYGGRTGMAKLMAKAMATHLVDVPDALLVPVPLHRWRIWSRGFNQSLVIAKHLAKARGNMIVADLLIRTKATPPLKGLGPTSRAKAVKGAFAIHPKHRASVSGAHIMLIDDVCTTGATANACASLLKKNGAKTVQLLCWARTLKDDPDYRMP